MGIDDSRFASLANPHNRNKRVEGELMIASLNRQESGRLPFQQ